MFPFWETVIAPIVEASDATRVLEIGALRGENTALMLQSLSTDAELHVIDPLPAFDPAEHERLFPGRYVFHEDLSLNVLPDAEPFDVALIDGDHNWYTVYNELRLLRESSRRAGRPLPLLILHDVCWPYGRRDLYYAPSQIPDEFRQPYAQRGMTLDRRQLLETGGMNITLDNALTEGGERNGVRTGLDDFCAEHDQPLRQIILPIYFGLAIVAEEAFLEEHPNVVAKLDEIESPEGTRGLLELSERIRLEGVIFEHNIDRVRDDSLAAANNRYLSTLRRAINADTDEENELRLLHLIDCVSTGKLPTRDFLRAPTHFMPKAKRDLDMARRTGATTDTPRPFARVRAGLAGLELLDEQLRSVGAIPGDYVDCGGRRGGTGIYARGFLDTKDDQRIVWVADQFRAETARGDRTAEEADLDEMGADLNQVREDFARFELLDDRVRFLQGRYSETLADAPIEAIALLRIGRADLVDFETILDHLYDRISIGGIVSIDGIDEVVGARLERYRADRGIVEQLELVSSGARSWTKHGESKPASPDASDQPAGRAPTVTSVPRGPIDLSVVVIFHNMAREAARTLQSLSRTYQQGIDDIDYEVIVIDNGSDPAQLLSEEMVASFGREFRLITVDEDADRSPTPALNDAIAEARGNVFALMIDGAHVLTPGVLKNGMAGLSTYGTAIVSTQHFYVGPGQQPEMVEGGYDQGREDALFAEINWPEDGYRLFDIGHFIGDRDWFDGMFESNCLFVPRPLLTQTGAFDDSFSMPGGGYANLELYERLATSPDVTLVSILGEGTFHQVHGGTTTNDGAQDQRRQKIFAYGEHYAELRGKALKGPAKPVHYVGALAHDSSRRTRSRRMVPLLFNKARGKATQDGVPTEPEPIAEDLRTAFIEAYWRSLAWRDQHWLGTPIKGAPTDLLVYQELVSSVDPDWIIHTGNDPGKTKMFASLCELRARGTVLAIGATDDGHIDNDRVRYLQGPSQGSEVAEEVASLIGDEPNAMVILGSPIGAIGIMAEFKNFAPFVPVGSYVIVEDTIVNGRPVWPGYGPGPGEAVKRILSQAGGFVADAFPERHGLTFAPSGFLRRIDAP
ncbi:MAG: class I SAM-dependent methyltransferase [Acidobacteria bacterium]|nr:class I SAM-dependent methyltransferase [Acidobacteriota bacterium]